MHNVPAHSNPSLLRDCKACEGLLAGSCALQDALALIDAHHEFNHEPDLLDAHHAAECGRHEADKRQKLLVSSLDVKDEPDYVAEHIEDDPEVEE